MKLRRYSTASNERWRTAQNAERLAFRSRKDKKPSTESQFFSQNLHLGSKFFSGKNILEVGCSPSAAIHRS